MKDMTTAPLVSILLPTRNRWEYFCLALESAVKQTYPRIEVVVSDNSTDNEVSELIRQHVKRYPQVKYHRTNGSLAAMENFQQCIELSCGEYLSFLMDDDLYAPDKIASMIKYFLSDERIALVTSYRQTINESGLPGQERPATRRLFEQPTVIKSNIIKKYIVQEFLNIIGEPTTPLFRKRDLPQQRFGFFQNRQYSVLADVATWFAVMQKGDLVYLPDSFSSFRIHSEQDQQSKETRLTGYNEWLNLIVDLHSTGMMSEAEYDQAILHWWRRAVDNMNSVITLDFDLEAECVQNFAGNIEYIFQWTRKKLLKRV